MANKYDWREAFRGADVGDMIRRTAKDMLSRGEANAERKRREQELTAKYTARPALEVEVVRVSIDPPRWRMVTVREPMAGVGRVLVEETVRPLGSEAATFEHARKTLEAELRFKIRSLLVQHGYCDNYEREGHASPWNMAGALARNMVIEQRGLIVPADAERWAGERRR